MKQSITMRPSNSLIFIMDYSFGKLPEFMSGNLVAFTDSCVAIGTLSEVDGETTIVVTDSLLDVQSTERLVFDGVVATQGGELSVCSTTNEKLLTVKRSNRNIHVKVFANDASEPDKIVVLIQ